VSMIQLRLKTPARAECLRDLLRLAAGRWGRERKGELVPRNEVDAAFGLCAVVLDLWCVAPSSIVDREDRIADAGARES
jgi:hypothetical protein